MRLGELDEASAIPRLPPSCAAVAPPCWDKRASRRRSDLSSNSPPPTLTCLERALDPTGSAHLHSLGPRGSLRHPPASPEQPAPSQVLPQWPRQAPPSWLRTAGPPLSPTPPFCAVPALPSPSEPPSRSPNCRAYSAATDTARSCVGGSRPGSSRAGLLAPAVEGAVRGLSGPSGAEGGRGHGWGPRRAGLASMIGVNSIHSSAGRLRSRSLCSVRYGRTHRGAETLCYGWPQRSRSLKPVLYTDLVVSRLQSRKKKKAVRALGRRPTPG